ncbi:aspartate dehydrogenase domain-containing protein [Sphingomonas cavernae]|nr:aspartate dehydrogenase domain-containing protein [Sphingomonas cavernae]
MRVGLIGFGFIGAEIYRRFADHVSTAEIAFVHNRNRDRLKGVPDALVLDDLDDARAFAPDLVVEVAGPEVSARHGEALLGIADYMPLSLTALADDALRARLVRSARLSGRSLFVAHGALVGLDSLVEWGAMWDRVSITFRKPPGSLGVAADAVTAETVLFDGSVREIARRYPHNVNAMVACALATTGLDLCHARLIADPGITHLELAIEAIGRDGTRLAIERRQPAVGVSGSEMAEAVCRSILRAGGQSGAIEFV